MDRAEVYRKAKNVDSSSSFGSQKEFDQEEVKIRHSMFPTHKKQIKPFQVIFGEERGLSSQYTLQSPTMISAMSFGALGHKAVRALSRGAKKAGIPMNTGEGGYPKYHLMEGADLIFQMGTAKFGVRTRDGHLDEKRLANVASQDSVKMIEVKMSQGAKPGKGGLLPKEKISEEIAELRGVHMGRDVVSPPCHVECHDVNSTVKFIARIQEITQLPVGMKMCLGRELQFYQLVSEMKRQNVFPDFITIDGSEGGTGAAPKAFMDDLGIPLYKALQIINEIMTTLKVRDKLKICASGKLINAGKQITAMSLGADATYSARGFMMAVGCIQALQCNANTCPVGITTHEPHLQAGFDIEVKANRVANYARNIYKDHLEIASALGKFDMNSYGLDDVDLGHHIFNSNLLLKGVQQNAI